ncbi:MAG: hypothetical protein AB7E80_08675 [Hyphomicrobiaceae bacterium]
MTNLLKTALVAALAVGVGASSMLVTGEAEARRGKGYFSQTYEFDRPMNGYEGHSAVPGYYCTYKKFPKRDCSSGSCKIVGWTLEQTCY